MAVIALPLAVLCMFQVRGWSTGSALPAVVVPDDLEKLDPQIRAYLEDHIRWAREAPENAGTHVTMGQVYFANGQWREARACFDRVAAMAPDNALAKYYGALASKKLGESEEVRRRLAETIEKDRSFAPAHFRIGVSALEEGAMGEAEIAFQNAIDHAPMRPAGYIGLAEVMNRKKNFPRAIELLKRAFELKTRDKTAFYLLGLAYRGLGRMDEAKKALAKGMSAKRRYMPDRWRSEIDKHRKGVAYQLRHAQRLIKNQRTKEAIDVLETVLAWHPENVEVLNNLAIAQMEDKQYEKALDLLLKAKALGGNAMATCINLAACYLELGDLAQAEVHADNAVELGPGVAQAFVTKSGVLMRLQRWEEAAHTLEKAVRLDDANPALHFDLGSLYMQLGRVEDARVAFAAAVEKNPRLLMAHLRLCDACLRVGARDEAMAALADAKRIAPNHRLVAALTERLEQSP